MQGGLCFLFVVQNFASAGKFCGKVRDGVRATLTHRFQFLPRGGWEGAADPQPQEWALGSPKEMCNALEGPVVSPLNCPKRIQVLPFGLLGTFLR